MIIALQTLVFFRSSLLGVLERVLSPYYKWLRGSFDSPESDEEDEEVFAEFDDEKGVVFFPPVYSQRYAAVTDCLLDERWCGKLEKVVDLGYHDMSFIKFLKDVPGVRHILGVDIESIPLRCSSDLLGCEDYTPKRENPLKVILFQGNAADPDYRLIGCDAVIAIEMIEHMLPHDLDRLVHTIFGFIKPWIAIITTPNADFNTLFLSLEKNGLRRLDHFFEWTREQFYDWCSNIVIRYPQFTVTTQGIGPGPPGTEHHGCCSQLALFINKNYVKQQDLSIDSLALVTNVPSPHNLNGMMDGFESPQPRFDNGDIYSKDHVESITNFYANDSCITFILTSQSSMLPPISLFSIECHDKTSQCNLDTEVSKNFLMFNYEDMYFTMLMPRRKFENRVYEIEDVNSRLNCTTFQARKFSKPTQNLMAKNKLDPLIHTRKVVDEIGHLIKMLNYNKDTPAEQNGHIWNNINWGDNAPYWNQFYNVVREYNYPFEVKSEECRILDLITEEINTLVDASVTDEFSTEGNKMEIPIERLMKAVQHITTDVDSVRDLLEWNGYEIVGNSVVHSRNFFEDTSRASTDVNWPDNDITPDLETTDIQSEMSEITSNGSTIVTDDPGRTLHRALDKKMQNLRTMLSADEDITTELDRVVCRLMKLAIRTSKGKQTPPPTKWMQCKLLDLLTLTEKAISKRRRSVVHDFPPMFNFHEELVAFKKMTSEDHAAQRIMSKYDHLIQEAEHRENYNPLDFGFEDDMEDGSNECLKDFDLDDIKHTPIPYIFADDKFTGKNEVENSSLVAYNVDQTTASTNSTSNDPVNMICHSPTRSHKTKAKSRKRFHKDVEDKPKINEDKSSKCIKENANIVIGPKVKTSLSLIKLRNKKTVNENGSFVLKTRRVHKNKKLHPTASRPVSVENETIPGSLIELCDPQANIQIHSYDISLSSNMERNKGTKDRHLDKDLFDKDVAATEENAMISIVMEDKEETFALRRSIGTDPDTESIACEQELGSILNLADDNLDNKHQDNSENVQTEAIFLYDINEPSTSKGVRHFGMDVQCGTDTVLPPIGLITPPTSVTRLPKIYSTGIKIDSATKFDKVLKTDSGTCTADFGNVYAVSTKNSPANVFSKGIKIEDSYENLKEYRYNYKNSNGNITFKSKCTNMSRIPKLEVKKSINDIARVKCSDFGMSTHEDTSKSKTFLPEVVMKSSGVMTEAYYTDELNYYGDISPSIVAKKCGDIKNIDFESKFRSTNEVLTPISPRTKSPDTFTSFRPDDSLSNLLTNVDYQQIRSRNTSPSDIHRKIPSNCKSHSPTLRPHSSTVSVGIRFKDSLIDTKTESIDTQYETNANFKINGEKPQSASPILFYTRVKMVDMEHDVTIEHNLEFEAPHNLPEPCKIVTPSYIRESNPEIECKIRNSLFKQNETCDFGMSVAIEEHAKNTLDLNDKPKIFDDHTNPEFNIEKQFFTDNIEVNKYFTKLSSQNDNQGSADVKDIPLTKGFGFKVKDTNENLVKKVEITANHVELLSEIPPNKSRCRSPSKTDIKPVSSKSKVKESASKIGESNCHSSMNESNCHSLMKTFNLSSIKSFSHAKVSSSNENDFKSTLSLNREVVVKTKKIKIGQRKLDYGGVHIHSLKDKHNITEDVVYQGKWDRHVPLLCKSSRRQLKQSTVVAKKVLEPLRNLHVKKFVPKQTFQIKSLDKSFVKKSLQVRSTKIVKTKQELCNKTEQMKKPPLNLARPIRANYKPFIQVSSKILKSNITSKNIKSLHVSKKSPSVVNRNEPLAKNEPIKRKDIVKYLPPYLRKRKFSLNTSSLNQSTDSEKTAPKNSNIKENLSAMAGILLSVQDEPHKNINYLVFRNELDNNNPPGNSSQSADVTNRNENTPKRRSLYKRSSSPMSQNSSTCSTSDSISTVRATNNWTKANKRNSTSSNKSSVGNTDSEPSPPINRNRKFSKKGKASKKADGYNNKENIPESSKKSDPDATVKKNFMPRGNIFMSQFKNSGLVINRPLHQTTNKPNIKIPTFESCDEKKRPKTAVISKRKSSLDDSLCTDNQVPIINSEASDIVLLVDTYQDFAKTQENIAESAESQEPVLKVVNSGLLTQWLEQKENRQSTENAILASMRQIVEDRLDFISNSLNESTIEMDDNISLKSFRTVVPTSNVDLNSTLKSEIENAINHSMDAVLGEESDNNTNMQNETDVDLLSFKSITSTSRYSDYYMAENESKTNDSDNKLASSVLDIFERKHLIQNTGGQLAVQAFSGFSIEPLIGDQPDYLNSIDSAMGSFPSEVRQATSEELFVSGRSSETYESCVVEEEIAVPEWLFRALNPHLSIPDPIAPFDSETGSPAIGYARRRPIDEDDEDRQEIVSLRLPMAEPIFDENGNVAEPGMGLGAGAGDGRGMHSDHSQDSSGRGSSLSSSDASSTHQSEAILIDPSAFTTQFEMFHEPIGTSMAVTTLVVPTDIENHRQGRTDGEILSTSRPITLRPSHPPLTSDGEADVSSLDTDVPDSS